MTIDELIRIATVINEEALQHAKMANDRPQVDLIVASRLAASYTLGSIARALIAVMREKVPSDSASVQ